MFYYLYILKMSNGQFYTGTSENLPARIQRHIKHQASRTTSLLGMEKLVYHEVHLNRTIAEKWERQIKKWSHAKKTALVENHLVELRRLAKRKQHC